MSSHVPIELLSAKVKEADIRGFCIRDIVGTLLDDVSRGLEGYNYNPRRFPKILVTCLAIFQVYSGGD